ncbi:GTP-binding protein [Rothia sp. AR01]|uniref:sulfate adenylyltransferase n=1 Tax=Rothia santali TaxID=2949643 RepID=A0A9X2HDN5_9MICC|nr:GTP-binding protein [Rothia santali]MCP3425787.1 GTP-binding protein [Rothia santali]
MSTTDTRAASAAPTDTLAAAGAGPRTLLRFATAGSVDDGKSTLVGRLLFDAKAILADQLDAVARTSAERGFGGGEGGLDLALLTDGLRAEREQGITIDVAYRYFATDHRNFVLADCPGHVEYTKNTVTGASTADAVVLLVDARHGVLEQTRRHLAVARLLRVPHVVVAVNKIDLVDYDAARYAEIEEEIRGVAEGLGVEEPHVVPVSALRGDNVVLPSERTPWYEGPTLLRLLETLPDRDRALQLAEPFRLAVQTVIRPQGGLAEGADAERFRDFRGYAGQIAAGGVRVGDRVAVAGTGATTEVTGLWVGSRAVEQARSPQSVTVEVADQLDLTRGSLLAAADSVPAGHAEFPASLAWLDVQPLAPGAKVLVKHGTATVKALVTEVGSRLRLTDLSHEPAERLNLNDIGTVRLRTAAPLPVEDYEAHRQTGAFLVVDPRSGDTLAAGIAAPQAPEAEGAGEDWLA